MSKNFAARKKAAAEALGRAKARNRARKTKAKPVSVGKRNQIYSQQLDWERLDYLIEKE